MTSAVIWKYPLDVGSTPQSVAMRAGASIRHVAIQHDHVMLWAEIDPELPVRERWFVVLATGEPFKYAGHYIGTVITDDGNFVWHIYEVNPPREEPR